MNMPAEEFQSNIQAVIETLLEKTKNLDQVSRYYLNVNECMNNRNARHALTGHVAHVA